MKNKLKKFIQISILSIFSILILSAAAYASETDLKISADPFHYEGSSSDNISSVSWYEKDEGEYFLFLPSAADPSSLKIWIDGAESITVNGEKISDGEVTDIFSDLGTFTVISKNKEYNITFMKSENIPSLFMVSESKTMKNINESPEHSVSEKGQMYLISENGEVEYNGNLTQIKGRGNSTWLLDKKPYQIKLDKSTDLFGMGKSKTWVLIANYLDKSMLHNTVTYSIADEMGLDYTCKSVYTDVYANGEYLGTYSLSEKVEIGSSRVDIKDLEELTEDANLKDLESFSRGGFPEKTTSNTYKYYNIPQNPQDISGGYILEFDYPLRYIEEASGFVTERGLCVVVKSPEYASKEQVEYIRNYVQEMEDAIYSPNGINDLGKHYSEYMDVSSAAKRFLIEELTMNFDSCMSSFYLYKDAGSPLYFGPIWDYDLSYGVSRDLNASDSRDPSIWWTKNRRIFNNPDMHSWLSELFKFESFRTLLTEEFNSSFKPIADEFAKTKIDELAEKISASYKMNYTIWDINSVHSYVSNNGITLEDNAGFFKSFFNSRLEFMEKTIGAGAYPKAASFKDIPPNAWYLNAVEFMAEEGYINGTANNMFSPNLNMSKGMFTTIIWNIAGNPRGNAYVSDIYSSDWYKDAVKWAVSANIAELNDENKFEPNSSITREEMISMLYNYTKLSGNLKSSSGGLSKFFDFYKINEDTINAFNWAFSSGIISGYKDNTLRPSAFATRAEASMIIYNYINLPN